MTASAAAAAVGAGAGAAGVGVEVQASTSPSAPLPFGAVPSAPVLLRAAQYTPRPASKNRDISQDGMELRQAGSNSSTLPGSLARTEARRHAGKQAPGKARGLYRDW